MSASIQSTPYGARHLLSLPDEMLDHCVYASGNPSIFRVCRNLHAYQGRIYKQLRLLYFEQRFMRQIFIRFSERDAPYAVPKISYIVQQMFDKTRKHDLLDGISSISLHQWLSVIENWSTVVFFDSFAKTMQTAHDFLYSDHNVYTQAKQSNVKSDIHRFIHKKAKAIDQWMRDNRHLIQDVRQIKITEQMPILSESIIHFHHVRELSLVGCNLVDLTNEIGSCVFLQKLDVTENCLDRLPESFIFLKEIEELRLKNNRFKKSLPVEVLYCKKMRSLDISGNQLKKLPVQLSFMQQLEYLDFSENRFSKYPDHLNLIPTLRVIKAASNHFKKLAECTDYTQVEYFDISNNPVRQLPSFGLMRLVTEHQLRFLKLDQKQMKLLHPGICSYFQSREVIPRFHIPRSPAMYPLWSDVLNLCEKARKWLFAQQPNHQVQENS